jgi:hypothetical protein
MVNSVLEEPGASIFKVDKSSRFLQSFQEATMDFVPP